MKRKESGDGLLAPGEKWIAPEDYRDGNTIYVRRPPLVGPSLTHAMTVEEAGPIIDIFTDLPWTANGMGLIALGWTVIAPACGALEWRPHLSLIGAKGSGKTRVLQKIIQPLLGDMYVLAQGMSTEAGIRQYLRGDALPVVCDEGGDPTSKKDKDIIEGRLALARSASSPSGGTLKETTTGTAIAHQCHSMFLFASTAPPFTQPEDAFRFAVAQLKSPHMMDPRKRCLDWMELQLRIWEHITPVTGSELLARTLWSFQSGHFDKLSAICTDAASQYFEDVRMGDQYGPLAAGVWSLMTYEVPPLNEVTDWFGMYDWGTSGEAETEDEGLAIIRMLLQARIQFDKGAPQQLTIGDLIDIAREGPSVDPTRRELARKYLRQLGIAIAKDDDGLLIANRSEWVKHQLRETPYANGWRNLIRTIPGAEVGPRTRFDSKITSGRTTFIPFSAITGEKPQEAPNE